jgi:hypothetical protein
MPNNKTISRTCPGLSEDFFNYFIIIVHKMILLIVEQHAKER